MGWFWPGPSWKPAHTVKPACLQKRGGQPGSGTSGTEPPPVHAPPGAARGGFGRMGRLGCAGWLAGISPAGTLSFQLRRVSSAPEGGMKTPRAGDVSARAARSPLHAPGDISAHLNCRTERVLGGCILAMGNMPGHIPTTGGRGEEAPFLSRPSPCRVSVLRDRVAGGCRGTCGTGTACSGPHGPSLGRWVFAKLTAAALQGGTASAGCSGGEEQS